MGEEMKKVELLPCPFCGGVPYIAGAAYFSKKLIMCNVCSAEHSIEKWNTRATTEREAKLIELYCDAYIAANKLDYLKDRHLAKAHLTSLGINPQEK